MKTKPSRRVAFCAVLSALSLAAASCASSDSDNGAVVEIGQPADEFTSFDDLEFNDATADLEYSDNLGSDDAFADLEYGDSLEDLTHSSAQAARPASIALPGFRSIEWDDLIPPGFSGDQILARYKDRLDAAEAGSPELDALYDEMNAEYDDASVNPQLDSEEIQLAGFVAPLTYDGDTITEFLLVPYFGACVHVPPPPANQTVMVTLQEGESLSLEESWGAVWVAGKMIATTTNTDLATAGYTIAGANYGVYQTQ